MEPEAITLPADFAEKTQRNARVSDRFDELTREGKHGFYETLFRIVHEEVARERQANLAAVAACSQESRDREERDMIGRCWDAINRDAKLRAIRSGTAPAQEEK